MTLNSEEKTVIIANATASTIVFNEQIKTL